MLIGTTATRVRQRLWRASMDLETKEKWLGFLIFLPVILFFAVFFIYPLLYGISLSFYKLDLVTLSGPFVGLKNYSRLLTSNDIWNAAGNSFYWAGGSLVLDLTLGVAMALLLNEKFPGRNLARGLALSPYLVPSVVTVAIWQWMFNAQYGIINFAFVKLGFTAAPVSWLSNPKLAMPTAIFLSTWRFFPFVVIALLPRLQTIPEDFYSAAKVDGASAWNRFTDVTLPHLRSLLVVVILLRFIFDFNDFTILAILTGGGPLHATETMPLLVYREMFGLNNVGAAATVAVLMLIMLLVLSVVYMRIARDTGETAF